ncbi:hypothetical protein BC936DRAFT_147605 [Jimgerdemannia flammicorona]|uniref:Uncharacterized protein n=1 Tax=Jimgerdemannia flammicorona TaxID=994334 RepID=A0A433D4Z8_9FUNG|nr:hypothetical protein BC936DRAFT_147605 [Jimgerdemannia flammicorona]
MLCRFSIYISCIYQPTNQFLKGQSTLGFISRSRTQCRRQEIWCRENRENTLTGEEREYQMVLVRHWGDNLDDSTGPDQEIRALQARFRPSCEETISTGVERCQAYSIHEL